MPFSSVQNSLGVIFGAGAVGRGFIGEILLDAGWTVTFIDASIELVAALNAGSYPHETVGVSGVQRKVLRGCTAVAAQDSQEVCNAVASANVIFTSVGSQNLPFVASALARGLLGRDTEECPVDVFLAENLHDGAKVMRRLLIKEFNRLEVRNPTAVLEYVGLVETSIGRMIPVPTQTQRREHPAFVAVEPHRQLPFDLSACRAPVPDVPELRGRDDVDFSFYTDRKLYIHNQGHCLTAYLGALTEEEEIAATIADERVASVVRAAMYATSRSLAAKYEQPLPSLLEHADDLLKRFANTALHDTVERVGRDPARKLATGDRFIGALSLTASWDDPYHVLPGVVLAAHQLSSSPGIEDSATAIARVRQEVCRIAPLMVGAFDALLEALSTGISLADFLSLLDTNRP